MNSEGEDGWDEACSPVFNVSHCSCRKVALLCLERKALCLGQGWSVAPPQTSPLLSFVVITSEDHKRGYVMGFKGKTGLAGHALGRGCRGLGPDGEAVRQVQSGGAAKASACLASQLEEKVKIKEQVEGWMTG